MAPTSTPQATLADLSEEAFAARLADQGRRAPVLPIDWNAVDIPADGPIAPTLDWQALDGLELEALPAPPAENWHNEDCH